MMNGWLAEFFNGIGTFGAFIETIVGHSSNSLLFFGCRNAPGFYLRFGLGQKTEASLAPREINAYI
jgi:hypothetical protein